MADESDIKRKAIVLALATALAVPAEGLRQWAYKDATGLPTICLGSTKGVKMGDFRTIPECYALLNKEMSNVIEAVDRCRPGLPPQILAAFSDASYNVGIKIACDGARSTAARRLADGDYAGACNELIKWDKANVMGVLVPLPGLTKRRALERDLCLEGVV
jgi:GH24 family phage-related lysozyme (muramidase)